MAIYKLGAMATPVCPTCSLCGRQCASATGRLQANAAPNASASSSTMPQFSGPFNPRPALTTTSASVSNTLPDVLEEETTFILGASTVVGKGTTSAVPSPEIIVKEFTFSVITFMSVFTDTCANAFPEKTFFLTVKPFEVSGKATAPETRPAFKRTANRGAIDLPLELLENTIILAPVCSAACAITFV